MSQRIAYLLARVLMHHHHHPQHTLTHTHIHHTHAQWAQQPASYSCRRLNVPRRVQLRLLKTFFLLLFHLLVLLLLLLSLLFFLLLCRIVSHTTFDVCIQPHTHTHTIKSVAHSQSVSFCHLLCHVFELAFSWLAEKSTTATAIAQKLIRFLALFLSLSLPLFSRVCVCVASRESNTFLQQLMRFEVARFTAFQSAHLLAVTLRPFTAGTCA